MNLIGLLEFVTVVDHNSFTSAAKTLRTSVAQVSRHVHTLEAYLGVQLLHRTTRKVTPTDLGHRYYLHCRPLLDGLQKAENDIMNLQSQPIGTLRLTAPVAFGEKIIAPLVSQFSTLYPDLHIDLTLTNQTLDLIADGFDLAIRIGTLSNSSLKAKKLGTRSLHICAAPSYIKRHGIPQTPADLHHHNCLLGTLEHWKVREKGQNKTLRVSGSMRCNSGPALLSSALIGNGMIQLPDYYVRPYLETGDLIAVLEGFNPTTEGIWAIYPENKHMLSKVTTFVDFLSANDLNHKHNMLPS